MSSYNGVIVLAVEVAIFSFAFYRANNNYLGGEYDLNSPVGGGATFTFWFFFLNLLFFAAATENVLPLAPAALLWFIRIKLKQE